MKGQIAEFIAGAWRNLYQRDIKDLLESKGSGIRCVLDGSLGAGKTTLLQERSILLCGRLGVPGASIFVLLADNNRLSCWNSAISEKTSAKFRCCTFPSFIRDELTVYYPLASSGCDEIVQKEIKPVFLPPEASIHLISKVIQARREKDGLFAAWVSSNERIATILYNNLTTAAMEGISAEEIGSRLYEALDRNDTERERILKDMDEIGLAYRKRCLELGVMDNGMAVEIYRKYILQDEGYRQSLCKRYRHLIIDDLQDTSYAMLELVETLLKSCDTAFLAYDPEFGSAELFHGSREIIESRIFQACKVVELGKAGKSDLTKAIYSATLNDTEIIKCRFQLERPPTAELRSEMLEQLAYRVCSLIKEEGFEPSDIAVLSTYGDIVTELVIGNILKKNGLTLKNTGNARLNAADSPLCSGLLALAKLCHPEYRLFPERGAVKRLMELLFSLDPVRSCKIARKTCGTFPFPGLPELENIMSGSAAIGNIKEKYEYVRNWIDNYKGKGQQTSISTFLQLSLMEVFLDGNTREEEILKAKKLIDMAERFCNAASRFGRNTGRDFIETADNILKDDEGRIQPEEDVNNGCVILTTPEAYIAGPIYNKILVISGLSSRHWTSGRNSELSNPRVLSASWTRGAKYTQEIEEMDSRRYLASILGAVLEKGCSRVIAFESLLSENGFENDGILPEIFNKFS